jgi:hypothetical protein
MLMDLYIPNWLLSSVYLKAHRASYEPRQLIGCVYPDSRRAGALLLDLYPFP